MIVTYFEVGRQKINGLCFETLCQVKHFLFLYDVVNSWHSIRFQGISENVTQSSSVKNVFTIILEGAKNT